MTPLASVFLLLAAQEPGFSGARIALSYGDEEPDPDKTGISLSIVQRFSVPDGELGGGADYEDLFDLGYGLGAEFDYLIPAGLGWRYGPYIGMGWDWFEGQEEKVGGLVLEADPLAIFSVLAGLKAAVEIDPAFYLEFRAGVGLSHILSTEAEVQGTFTEVELLESSSEIAGELGARAGFKLGKLVKLDFGFGARFRGSAEEGEIPLDPETLIQYFMDVGVGFRF